MYEIDENALYKFHLCVMPTQFGKTNTSINEIKKQSEFEEKVDDEKVEYSSIGRFTEQVDSNNENVLHIICTMNTILGNAQFSKRLEVLMDMYGNDSVVIFNSQKNKNIKCEHVSTVRELLGLMYTPRKFRAVIMCSNSKRFGDLEELIKQLNQHRNGLSKVCLYFDEIHKYLNDKLRRQIEQIHDLDIVSYILGLTATPKNFWNEGKWSRIKIFDNKNITDKNYCHTSDMIWIHKESVQENKQNWAISYASEIFQTPEFNNLLVSDSKIFVPADKSRKSHDDMKNLILKNYPHAAVIVLNGKEKTINFDERTIILETKTDEINNEIFRKIKEYHLERRPIFYTGHICVGMGQTLVNQNLGNFDAAILSHIELSDDDIYQLFGRLTGRMKDWKKYKKTNIFCPKKIMDICTLMEKCAFNMLFKNGETVSKNDYLAPMNNYTHLIVQKISPSAIPVKIIFVNEPFRLDFFNKKEKNAERHKKLINAFENKWIILEDKNPEYRKFNLYQRHLKVIRTFTNKRKKENFRFKSFTQHFSDSTENAQTSTNHEYNLDIAKDEYIENNFINPTNIGWITFQWHNE